MTEYESKNRAIPEVHVPIEHAQYFPTVPVKQIVGADQISRDAVTTEWISIPIDEIPRLVTEYVKLVETERTNRLCKCVWAVHPDDEHLTEKRRQRRTDVSLDCPVHTREGYLLGLFDFVLGKIGSVQPEEYAVKPIEGTHGN